VQLSTPSPRQIRTRRFPQSGSSVDAARGDKPQILTLIRGLGSGKSRSRSWNRSQWRRLRWLRRQSHFNHPPQACTAGPAQHAPSSLAVSRPTKREAREVKDRRTVPDLLPCPAPQPWLHLLLEPETDYVISKCISQQRGQNCPLGGAGLRRGYCYTTPRSHVQVLVFPRETRWDRERMVSVRQGSESIVTVTP
jgi:hypothetical protein